MQEACIYAFLANACMLLVALCTHTNVVHCTSFLTERNQPVLWGLCARFAGLGGCEGDNAPGFYHALSEHAWLGMPSLALASEAHTAYERRCDCDSLDTGRARHEWHLHTTVTCTGPYTCTRPHLTSTPCLHCCAWTCCINGNVPTCLGTVQLLPTV